MQVGTSAFRDLDAALCDRQGGAVPPGRGRFCPREHPPRARPWRRGSPDPIPNSEVKPAIAESTAASGRGRIGRRARGGCFLFRRAPGHRPGALRRSGGPRRAGRERLRLECGSELRASEARDYRHSVLSYRPRAITFKLLLFFNYCKLRIFNLAFSIVKVFTYRTIRSKVTEDAE